MAAELVIYGIILPELLGLLRTQGKVILKIINYNIQRN